MVDSSSDVTTSKMFLALEVANGGDLQQRLHGVGHLSEPVSRFIFVQLVSAIKYCHGRSPPIVHRDLNPANILLVDDDEFARVKVRTTSTPVCLCGELSIFFSFVCLFVMGLAYWLALFGVAWCNAVRCAATAGIFRVADCRFWTLETPVVPLDVEDLLRN